MKEEKNNIKYTAEYIRKYLDGELSDPEMQALEKAALEDPFLADALEGIEESRNHPVSFESGMADLEKRLAARTGSSERKPSVMFLFSKWKIAASVLFILGITIFTYKYLNRKSRAELANTTQKDSSLDIPASSSSKKTTDSSNITSIQKQSANAGSDTAGNALNAAAEDQKSIRKEKALPIAGKKNIPLSEKQRDESQPGNLSGQISDTNTLARSVSPAGNDNPAAPRVKSVSAQQSEKSSGLGITRDKVLPENFIKGVVVDNNGKPIPSATVKFKGSGNGTITDTGGSFKLYMKNPSVTELEFIHPGYEPATAELIPDSTFINKIKLHEIESSLSEVTVPEKADVARSKKSADAFYESKKREKPPTVLGWEDFSNYINKNKKIISADSLLKGEEIISFMLNTDGQLSSFKIEKSISPAHDAEILSLIRSAPPIKPQNAKKQICRVTISFP